MNYFTEVHGWWYVGAVIVGRPLMVFSKTVAVVVIGWCLSPELAKMAIPLVLRPVQMPWPSRALKAKRGVDAKKNGALLT
ncbi:hypothetical protein [Pedosphaera parvula]|uniref:Uncharacterized protein n=1 Tax=Pedosphaera parvula (strain Ellin514) TaxID=320771 RepID=B9XI09_PEDPL|nr:hypothetical protein [Pedosphaera parvula]EEF60502.1 hypothetical protein Cflav_PD3472 [Pedosphaera parvula Ellin514]